MAHYIEDPEIARAIDEMKSRWPAVGAAADHPLTEWFIRRKAVNQFGQFVKAMLMLVMIYEPIFVAQTIKSLAAFVAVFGWMAYWAIAMHRRAKEKKKSLDSFDDVYLSEIGESQARQIWVTPIDFRSIAGIEIGKKYYRQYYTRWPLGYRLFAWAGGVAGGAGNIYLFRERISGWIYSYLGGAVNFGLFVVCVCIALWSFMKFGASRPRVASEMMRQIKANILSRQQGVSASLKKFRSQWPEYLLGLGFAANTIFVLELGKSSGIEMFWLAIDVSCLVWSVGVLILLHRYERRDMNEEFEQFVRATEPEFIYLYRSKIGCE